MEFIQRALLVSVIILFYIVFARVFMSIANKIGELLGLKRFIAFVLQKINRE